jgi:hypothetical protein
VAVGRLEVQRDDGTLPRPAERHDPIEHQRRAADRELEVVGVVVHDGPFGRSRPRSPWSHATAARSGRFGLRGRSDAQAQVVMAMMDAPSRRPAMRRAEAWSRRRSGTAGQA